MTDEDGTRHLGDAITALLDGELSDDEAVAARRHLAECPACTAEMAGLGQMRSWLRDLPPVDPPPELSARILGPSGPLSEILGLSGPLSGILGSPLPPGGSAVGPAGPSGPPSRAVAAPPARSRRWAGVGALVGCAAATLVVLGLATPHDPPTSPPVAHFVEAHATAGGGEPVSHLAPAVVPVSFRR
ncbi:MAG: anti-sigma factor family protein [Acidimicrobiales bacterium]